MMDHSEKVEIENEDKTINQIRIILKLAEINAYDIHGRLRDPSGLPVKDTDIIQLILLCTGKVTDATAMGYFITLLKKANIDPSWIDNPDIRRQLESAKLVTFTPPKVPKDVSVVRESFPDRKIIFKRKTPPKLRPRKKQKLNKKTFNWEPVDDD